MLVLTRKVGESIIIGDNIEVKIVAIDGDQIKVGINAPNDVKIYRDEIYKTIQEENREALNVETSLLNELKNF